jgi:hypothetical protein
MTASGLPSTWNPLLWLIAMTVLFASDSGILAYYGEEPTGNTEFVWAVSFGCFCAWWVFLDRRQRRFAAPLEFDGFVLFAWAVVLPYYLYRTRGRAGLALGIGAWLLYLVPALVALTVHLASDEPL